MEPFDGAWTAAAVAAFDEATLDVADRLVLSLTVLGGPDGDVPTTWSVADGKLSTTADADADVVMTIPWDDAMRVLRGDVAPAVVYMQGKLKASGDMTRVLSLLERASGDTFGQWRQKVVAAS